MVRLLLDFGADRTIRKVQTCARSYYHSYVFGSPSQSRMIQGSFLGFGGDTAADIAGSRPVLELLQNHRGLGSSCSYISQNENITLILAPPHTYGCFRTLT